MTSKRIKVLSTEQELEQRREIFKLIRRGTLFSLGNQRFFIAIYPGPDDDSWRVVELTHVNRDIIASGHGCFWTNLNFKDMKCLNICLQ